MNRRLPGATALLLVAAGVLATACDVTPPAASANGTSISTGTLNTELATLGTTTAGGCLLQVQNPQLTTEATQGSGGSGTYTMAFTDAVLNNQVGDLLAEQYAISKGITVSPSDLNKATSDFEAILDGEISSAVQQSQAAGTLSLCQTTAGSPITGAQLLAGLPSSVRQAEIHNEAVDERLLARGANLSDAAAAQYYAANQPQFTFDCVSDIATDTQAHAQQLVAQLNAGRLLRRRGQGQLPRHPDARPTAGRWAATSPRPRSNRPCSCRVRRRASPSARCRTRAPAAG